MNHEREAFVYGYLQGARDRVLFGMEPSRAEAETAYDQWVRQGEIDPLAKGPQSTGAANEPSK